ncbi:hypothetical protein ACFW1M_18930 [Streptomyces inhibens]
MSLTLTHPRAGTVEVMSSHLPLDSRPDVVAGLIEDAARSTTA